jgi:hypothetical protein
MALIAFGAVVSNLLNPQALAGEPGFANSRGMLEKQTLDLINHDRIAPQYFGQTRGRADPLVWDDRLAAVARAIKRLMAHRQRTAFQPRAFCGSASVKPLLTVRRPGRLSDFHGRDAI